MRILASKRTTYFDLQLMTIVPNGYSIEANLHISGTIIALAE